jgi:subtilisin family serine protease
VVAVVDSGIAFDHPELLFRTWGNVPEVLGLTGVDDGNGYIDDSVGWDFFDDDELALDEHGHGTLVASVVAGEPQNDEGGAGVAPIALVMPLRVLDDFNRGAWGASVADVTDATTYAANNGAKIINLSLGGSPFSATELLQFQWLDSHGVLVVAAAGNGGNDGIGDSNDVAPFYPASYAVENIISVVAIDRSGQLARFSNRGVTSVDLAAPGTDIFGASVLRSTTYFESFNTGAPGWTVGEYCLVCYRWSFFTDAFFNVWLGDSQDVFAFPVNYLPNTDAWAQSPWITLPLVGPQLHYRIWHQLEFLDPLLVEASADGINWELVDIVFGPSGTAPPGLALPAGGIRRADLSNFEGMAARIRFRLLSDSAFQADGAYIDDVAITRVEVFEYDGTQYEFSDGTSFSAPLVSGIAALVMSQRPELTHRQIRKIILDSVDPVPALSGLVATGGRLNALAAVERAIASLCGDVDDSGVLEAGDVDLYRAVLAGAQVFDTAGLSKCKTIAGGTSCSIRDLVPLRRRIQPQPLGPGIEPTCSGAAGL